MDGPGPSVPRGAFAPSRRRQIAQQVVYLLKDKDLAQRANVAKAVLWSLFGGLGIGIAIGYYAAARSDRVGFLGGTLIAMVATALLTAGASGAALLVSELAGRAAGTLLHPGGGTRKRSDHSLPRSLLARGLLEEAVHAFEVEVATDPSDPEAYLEIARIQRDRLGRPEEALLWFRRARDQSRLRPGEARVLVREIVELARKHLQDPARAAPDLARHAEAYEKTSEEEWARSELAEVKREIKEGAKSELAEAKQEMKERPAR